MRPFLEFWLSLSRLNRIAVDCLLFWLTAGTVVSLGRDGLGHCSRICPAVSGTHGVCRRAGRARGFH